MVCCFKQHGCFTSIIVTPCFSYSLKCSSKKQCSYFPRSPKHSWNQGWINKFYFLATNYSHVVKDTETSLSFLGNHSQSYILTRVLSSMCAVASVSENLSIFIKIVGKTPGLDAYFLPFVFFIIFSGRWLWICVAAQYSIWLSLQMKYFVQSL